jgi:uncharacterized membrane protein AbrB (regulator of aidB expression)
MFLQKLAKLIDVKTLVTFTVTGVFAYLALTNAILPETSMTIVTMVIGFYFGTQAKGGDK